MIAMARASFFLSLLATPIALAGAVRPLPPIRQDGELWVMAADPQVAAEAEMPVVATIVGWFADLAPDVCYATADIARQMMVEEGARGLSECQAVDLPEPTTWWFYDHATDTRSLRTVPAGRQWVVKVFVENVDEVAAKERGRVTVGLAKAFGLSIRGRVNAAMATRAADAYETRGVDMLFAFTDASRGRSTTAAAR